ncbi:MAG TPA: protein kinase [Candidatus Paceibacterota bacterium]|nr:protein kinase [Verrucomicrobiota bacterium]HSA10107.1 protein kinase [Candidatus Paceibacterota bacterium]
MANPEHEPSGKRKCVGCGAELVGSVSPDLCPKCLLKLAMETRPGPGPGGTIVLPDEGAKSRGLPHAGEQLGSYAIVRALGAGGMGAVYEAQDQESGRRVALKVLSHTLDSPEARERFFREGRLAASINHPNSVYIFGTEEIGGTPVITMELVAGGTLQDRVRARGPLPVGEAVDAVLQLIEGLDAAQRVGILHRDIKPSNCYVSEDGTVKIGDFGLSISTAVRTEPALTATGAFLGTPAFCSPEQLRGEELNTRSDMYSVGATLYYLLTGRTPFEAKNMVQLLATVLEQRAPSPRQFRPDIPKGLARAILRCLEKQPGERFKSYTDLARALTPYGSAAPTPATLGLRFLAGVADLTILGLSGMVINLLAFGSPMDFMQMSMQFSPKLLAWVFGWFCVAVLYYAVFEGLWGAAAGKALCGLRVVGPDRNPPGFGPALLRAMVWLVPPFLPYWLAFGANPKDYLASSQWIQTLMGLSCYVVMALLFVTARRRNGFAALQDLVSRSRVVSHAALVSRPVLSAAEAPPPAVESAITIGPYHVLQALADTAAEKWFLAYDLKLLRKVWVRVVPPDTPPVPAQWRALGRVGRLRWLTGKRTLGENWDAFEALTGRPFLEVIRQPQPWREVRYWLHDLAVEISAAEKDGTLPDLALDRLWITADGRAKLLDFPAPGLPPRDNVPPQPASSFLNAVAAAALAGRPDASAHKAGEVNVVLPLHARTFLKTLSHAAGADAIVTALKPLLNRPAAVSRLRRAALVGACMAFPLMGCFGGYFGMKFVQELTRKNPGLMELHTLLQLRSTARIFAPKHANLPTDRQLALYIAHHYRGLITNSATWSNPMVLALIKSGGREFAEQSVADHPTLTEAEIKAADAAVGKHVPREIPFSRDLPASTPTLLISATLLIYVAFPAVVAAVLFRGGLALLIAGVTYVRRDGQRASRLRLFWRAIVTWSPVFPVFVLAVLSFAKHSVWAPWLALVLLGLLAAVSVALPTRGLQDRLAGTWPVPR